MLTFIVLPHCGIRSSKTLLPDTTSSHIILTPEQPVLALPPKIRKPSGEQLVPLLTTLVCRGPRSNPVPPDLGADTLPTEAGIFNKWLTNKVVNFEQMDPN